jgi:hypothetical protein
MRGGYSGFKMNKSLEENRKRLFALDASLRGEADKFLNESGLGKIIRGGSSGGVLCDEDHDMAGP